MLTKEMFDEAGLTPDTKVVFISHNDLDGAGEIIVGRNYFKDCKYFTVANASVDKVTKLVLFAPDYADREAIFITDCSVTDPKVISYIDFNCSGKTGRKVFLFDHHGTALFLNQHNWANVTQVEGVSGTKLFWQFMEELVCDALPTDRFMKLDNLVNAISEWDTWMWTKTGNMIPKKLAALFDKTGIEYFLSKYVGDALDGYKEWDIFNAADKALMADFDRKFDYIIWPGVKKSARIIPIPIGPNQVMRNVKCVSINDNPGDMAEQLYEEGVDFVFLFYHDTISMRCRTDEIDLGAWAKQLAGGGGHARSAGFKINKDTKWLVDLYLNEKFK